MTGRGKELRIVIVIVSYQIIRAGLENGFKNLSKSNVRMRKELLLGICFLREGFEAAFGPDRMGEKGG